MKAPEKKQKSAKEEARRVTERMVSLAQLARRLVGGMLLAAALLYFLVRCAAGA